MKYKVNYILIEPKWNLKYIIVTQEFSRNININRTKVEFKVDRYLLVVYIA